jgi:TetR/AcrR family transcriptional regulator, transcriptional repressor of bet genes
MTETRVDRPPRRDPAAKVDRRRDELAESALRTLAERGYARTSLRDIASNSEFTHGVIHYYFRDKIDLITYCVRYYKAQCVTRYDELIETAATDDELRHGFGAKLRETLLDEGHLHRLWYDLRSQSLFEPGLFDDVRMIDGTLQDMIWRIVTRYAELAGRDLVVAPATAYGMLDGLFEQALTRHLTGDPTAADELPPRVAWLLPHMVKPGV